MVYTYIIYLQVISHKLNYHVLCTSYTIYYNIHYCNYYLELTINLISIFVLTPFCLGLATVYSTYYHIMLKIDDNKKR